MSQAYNIFVYDAQAYVYAHGIRNGRIESGNRETRQQKKVQVNWLALFYSIAD